MTGAQAALAAGAGAFLSLERKAVAQLMLSRPLVAAPLIGWCLGDARTGLAVGVPLELFFLGSASYGASTPEHETLAAMFAVALAVTCGDRHLPFPGTLAIALFAGLLVARAGRLAEAALERWNVGLVHRAELFVHEGRLRRATRLALAGMLATALLGAVAVSLGILAGPAVGAFEELLGSGPARGLTLGFAAFSGLAAALGLRSVQTPGGRFLSFVAGLTVAVVFGARLFFAR